MSQSHDICSRLGISAWVKSRFYDICVAKQTVGRGSVFFTLPVLIFLLFVFWVLIAIIEVCHSRDRQHLNDEEC